MKFDGKFQQKYAKVFLAAVIIILAAFVLTPRYWEPGGGGESWKQWVAARILREEGEFPVIGLGPLYVVYLQLFSFFDYPLSMSLEHVITHLFAYMAIFLMLQKFLRSEYALLLTIAWIPKLAVVEPGGTVAGIGFVSLYLMRIKNTLNNEDYLPLTLMAAALSHSAYIPFLAGHIIGVLVKKWRKHSPLISFSGAFSRKKLLLILSKIGLIALVILTIAFPPVHYNNHGMVDPKYMPVNPKNPAALTSFMLGNAAYVMRTVPESEWIYQDWYFTHEKAYGGATNLFQAVYKKPETVIMNILRSMRLGIQAPAYFFTGTFPGIISLIFWALPAMGLIGLFLALKKQGNFPLIFSIGIGSMAVFWGLLLTAFNTRYIVTLLPMALLTLSHVGLGLYTIRKFRIPLFSMVSSIPAAVKSTRLLVVASSIFLILTAQYPFGKISQIEAVLGHKAFFSGKQPVSMANAHQELLESLHGNPKVLALEDQWITSFTDIGLDNIHQVLGLPPFPDPSGETEKMLSNLDVILVSNKWKTERATLPTQTYLRYILHVKPFLEKAVNEGWTVKDVEGYGKVYQKVQK